jgi:hypothetical protein
MNQQPRGILAQSNASFSRSRLGRSRRQRQVCAWFSTYPGITDTLLRIVESTDARLFGLDDAEVQKRRRYVGYVRTEIQVGSFILFCLSRGQFLCSISQNRNIDTLVIFLIHNADIQFILPFASLEHERFSL